MALDLKGRISLDWSQVNKAMRGTQMAVRGFVNVTGRGLYDVGHNLQRMAFMWGIAGAGIAAWGLKAAGTFQLLKLKMEAALGDPQKAAGAWRDTVKLFIESPLELEPLVKAKIMLANFGITGKKSLEAVAGAAMMTGRQVEDVASAIGSLETEPLRRMGITSRSRSIRGPNGDDVTKFKMSALSPQMKPMSIEAAGIDAARLGALQLMYVKYTAAMIRASKTWVGLWSTFKGAAVYAVSEVSTALMVQLIPYLEKLNKWLVKGIESGAFERFGQKIYRWVATVMRFFDAVIIAWNQTTKATREQLANWALAIGAFIVFWKAGFVEVMVKTIGYVVTTWATAFATMLSVITLFSFGIVGFKIGKVIEDSFGLSSLVMKCDIFIDELMTRFLSFAFLLPDVGAFAGEGLLKGLLGNPGAAAEAVRKIANRVKMAAESTDLPSLKRNIETRFAAVDEVSGDKDTRTMAEKFDAAAAAAKKEFLTVKGWTDTFAGLIPESIKKYIDDIGKVLLKLPDVKLSDGLLGGTEKLKNDFSKTAASAEKINKATAPLRGFFAGFLGFKRPGSDGETSTRSRSLYRGAEMTGDSRWVDVASEQRFKGRRDRAAFMRQKLLPGAQWPDDPNSTAPRVMPKVWYGPGGVLAPSGEPRGEGGMGSFGSGSPTPDGMRAMGRGMIEGLAAVSGAIAKSAAEPVGSGLRPPSNDWNMIQVIGNDIAEKAKRLGQYLQASPGLREPLKSAQKPMEHPNWQIFQPMVDEAGKAFDWWAKDIMEWRKKWSKDAPEWILRLVDPRVSAAPLMDQRSKTASASSGSTSPGKDVGAMVSAQNSTNELLNRIYSAKATFSFAG